MVDRIYPTELHLNRTNSSDTEAPFLDLNLCISNGTVSTKIYDKRDDFDFDIVNFPFRDIQHLDSNYQSTVLWYIKKMGCPFHQTDFIIIHAVRLHEYSHAYLK